MLKNILLASAAVALSGLVAQAAHADVKIGAVGPLTGEYAVFGKQMKEGVDQAVADMNAAGGVVGQKVQVFMGDDACDPRQAVSVANDMVNRGVVMVDGHFCSGSSIPASKVYTEQGILEISPASTNPDFTDKGAWDIFRTCGRDDQQGQVAGSYLASHYKDDKIAILDDNSAYGKGLADQTRKTLNADGVKETMDASYQAGQQDYSALVSRMKQADIKVIYIGGYYTETGLIARQAAQQGMKVTIMGGDALVTKDYFNIAGPASNGTLMTFPADPRNNPAAANVVAEFKKANIDPEGYVLYSYAAAQVWAEAADKAKSTDPQKVAAALHSGDTFHTVIGPIAFDSKGDPKNSSYAVYQWENGNYKQLPQTQS